MQSYSKTLKESIAEAHAWMDKQYDALYTASAEYPGSHWALPVSKDLIKATDEPFRRYQSVSRPIAEA